MKIDMSIGGIDVSKYIISIHADQSVDLTMSPSKIDIELMNSRLRFRDKFAPTDRITCTVIEEFRTCDSVIPLPMKLFDGQVQLAYTDEIIAKIEASCDMGPMAGSLKENVTYKGTQSIEEIIKNLVGDRFGWPGGRDRVHVNVKKMTYLPIKELTFKQGTDFLSALDELCSYTYSWYFADEHGDFWYQDPEAKTGAINLNGFVVKGDDRTNLQGYYNVVPAVGGSMHKPQEPGAEIQSHQPEIRYTAIASDDELQRNGILVAPPIYIPEADKETIKNAAENALYYYLQKSNVNKPKLWKIFPPLRALVSYSAFNAQPGKYGCSASEVDEPSDPIYGTVTHRVVDINSDGLTCDLEVATGIGASGNPASGDDISNMTDDQLKQEISKLTGTPFSNIFQLAAYNVPEQAT